MTDPVSLAADLIKCPSVTPADAGALDLLQAQLTTLGFNCTRLPFETPETARVDNLFAQLGSGAPHFCFAGHTDVVPVGNAAQWQYDPFGGVIADGYLHGRGAADMKGAIAAFVAAVTRFSATPFAGTISFLITGDEEGPSVNGTVKMLDWLRAQGIHVDDCIVGEPTNPNVLGEMVKIGRRGSVNGVVRVAGTQGHVAYPHLANNPAPKLLALMQALTDMQLDDGSKHFQPSNLEVTQLLINNAATNVIPAEARGRFNIRYNDHWDSEKITAHIEATLAAAHAARDDGTQYALELSHTGDCFLTEPGALTAQLTQSIEAVTGTSPVLSTSGGTSDARFIKDHARVVEFGLTGQTMHKVDECVKTADIEALTEIYARTLTAYFA